MEPPHSTDPAPQKTPIEPAQQALAAFFDGDVTDTRRVFHGRGHFFDGAEHLCIDWYPPVLLITAYKPMLAEDLDALLAAISSLPKQDVIRCVMLQERFRTGAPATVLRGEDIQQCVVTEGPLKFDVHPGQQQNAGLFLDMRPFREWLMANASGWNVLNLFAYTCSLSVAALAGDARQVVNVDMSKTSIRWGEDNHGLNDQDPRKVRSIPHNLFRSWGRIKQFGRYDCVIIDPPTRQRGSFDAQKNYGAVLKRLHQLVTPDAEVIATINSPYLGADFLQHQFQRYANRFRFIEEMPVSPEFADRFPERGLQILRFKGP